MHPVVSVLVELQDVDNRIRTLKNKISDHETQIDTKNETINNLCQQVEDIEETVVEIYEVLLEAEKAGVNISGLLDRLDVAGEYLTLARMCLKTGNLADAARNAGLSVEALDGLMDDASVLRDKAIQESGERFWMTIGGSVVGVATVVCSGWLSWSWFKRWYHRRALEMTPEVVEYES